MTAPERDAERRGGAPEAIGDVLRRVLGDAKPAARRGRGSVARSWERAAGAELAPETRPSTLRRGVLTVDVRSAALLHELESFRREELLSRLLAEEPTGRVTGLKFRLGAF